MMNINVKKKSSLTLLPVIVFILLIFSILTAGNVRTYAAASAQVTSSKTASAQKRTVKVKTTVRDLPGNINCLPFEKVTKKISISPATGKRIVKLQRLDSKTGKWKTIHKYTTKNTKKASVTIKIESEHRKRTTGTWRISVEANAYGKGYIGKPFTVTSANLKNYNTNARACVIYCVEDDNYIYKKNSDIKRAQASITKLMSAVIALESGKIGDTTTISSNAANTPWGILYMSSGDKYKNMDLLYAMMLPSANDAATAMAEGISGSVSNFVSKMNKKAYYLGLKNTHFVNPHGLDASGHYSSASDVARLTAYAYKKKPLQKMWLTKTYTFKSIRYGKSHTVENTDELIGYKAGFKGGKTGTEDDSGYCFSGVYVCKGKTYVTTVLGCDTEGKRWEDTKKLHKYIETYSGSVY